LTVIFYIFLSDLDEILYGGLMVKFYGQIRLLFLSFVKMGLVKSILYVGRKWNCVLLSTFFNKWIKFDRYTNKFIGRLWVSWNPVSGGHTLFSGVNKFLFLLPTFIIRFGWNLLLEIWAVIMLNVWVSRKSAQGRPYSS